ncbi:conserved Plasmodium protein, unknown function [Plasmodium sp. DRC-Itaito]|nr:conserved Plasmodium protein, unknown function [Plasmodium sp. DRC-Itaito]
MSTIRWVDLLSSESNFSHSKANNDEINEKLKKKKVIYKSETDLNNSFLNSYNGDLDNSNVGINLKIKNMCIKEKKDIKVDQKISQNICSNKKDTVIQKKNMNTNYDEKINVVHNIQSNDQTDKKEKEESMLNKINNFDNSTNAQSRLYNNNIEVTETKNRISHLDEKENNKNNNNNNNNILEKKKNNHSEENITNQDDVKLKVNLSYPEKKNNDHQENKKDKNKELVTNISNSKEEQHNGLSVISSNEECIQNVYNSNNVIRTDKDTCKNTEDASNRNKEKISEQSILKKKHVTDRNKEQSCRSRDSSKKRNSAAGSSKKVIGSVDNKKNIESLMANVSENNKNDSLKMNQEKNIKYVEHSRKGKNKRKERNNNMENSILNNNNSISVLDYTVSHDVTLDDNNIPLNPTKKMKNKMKDLKNLQVNKNDDIFNMNKSKIFNSFKQVDNNNIGTNKVIEEENNTSIKENENIKFPRIQNMNTMIDKEDNPFYNVMNNNIDLEKFKNFNNNFINYIGDIRNNFNDSLCTANRNRVNSRLKEIAVGKSTKEYKNYVKLVKYEDRLEDDPATPNAYEDITNAKFQAKYNLWRKKLHKFDSLN